MALEYVGEDWPKYLRSKGLSAHFTYEMKHFSNRLYHVKILRQPILGKVNKSLCRSNLILLVVAYENACTSRSMVAYESA
ncbi:hypothetical protein Csa_012320 [Cucumis sativus]|nr:hypothetical protein Csa_012320 [Cucumis sativus]